jgi:hypothetical protein
VKKTTSRKTAGPNARATRNRPKRALAQFELNQVAPEFRAAFEGPPAEYDIDAIEAHVTQLFEAWSLNMWGLYTVEHQWSSRLKAYALAWAMGLNELADPEGTRCEQLTLESFEAAPDPYDVEFEKLVSSVGHEFARLARIPAAYQKEFFLRVADNLEEWMRDVHWKNNSCELLDCLNNTKHSAALLYRDLDRLRRHLEEKDGGESYRILLLKPSVVSRMLRYLPAIIEAIHIMTPPQREGRPRGRKEYPGLADLISGLEASAQSAEGGFGIPNKKLKKGRLIEALDWLKAFLADNEQWSWVAQFLPAPGQHPLSVYEGAMMGVYKQHITRIDRSIQALDLLRTLLARSNHWRWLVEFLPPPGQHYLWETKVEHESEANVENIDPADVRTMRAYAHSMRYIVDG